MKTSSKKYLMALAILAFILVGCDGNDGKDGAPGETVFVGLLTASSATSLEIKIDGVTIDSAPVVAFTAKDASGINIAGLTTSHVRFNIAKLVPGTLGNPSTWQNYINVVRGGVLQGTSERVAANLEDLGNGQYRYTFDTDITDPAATTCLAPLDCSFDPSATHRVGIQISGFPASNPIFDFRPDGNPITLEREIVKTANCNSCHNKLAIHGGGRVETKYCVTCHNPGSIDPDTGNTVDFKVMVHKIHYGEELPSVINGTPYQIIGYGGNVHDYSTVVFPQDIRNCTKCHDGADPETPQGDNWKTKPSEEACGSCHDDIYFGTAPVGNRTVPHLAGPSSNEFCVDCHVNGLIGPDFLVEAVHTNPVKVAEPKFEFNILSICGTPVGSDPDCPLNPLVITVEFSVSDPTGATTHGHGNLYDVAGPTNADRDPEFGARASLNILSGWDSSDYTNDGGLGSRPARANSLNALTNAVHVANGVYTIDLAALPVGLTSGSGVVAIEGHPRAETVIDSGTFDISVPVRGEVAYFGINGSAVVERRVAVDIANKCDNCHDKLSLHGANRADNAQLCVICHNPRNTDIGRRDIVPDPDGDPGDGIPDISPLDGKTEETIDFKILIHAIHAAQKDDPDTTAVEGHGFREKGIVVYGYGNNAHDYGHVRFPGILNDCTTCHNTGTYELTGRWATPLQNGILASTIQSAPTAVTAGDYTTQKADQTDDLYTTPTAAVCSACHDDALSQEHMEFIGGAKFVVDQATIAASFETCSVCHGPGNVADLNLVHGIE